MTYFKVAIAAVKRYRMEQSYRQLIMNNLPKRKRNAPFAVCMMMLRQKGFIKNKEVTKIVNQYRQLSQTIHGI